MAQKAGSRGRVISIEAAPGNVARLIQNVRLNRFDDRVEVVPAVCSDSPGIVTFHVNSKSDMSCRVELPRRSELDYWLMRKHWQPIAVRSDRLSALVGRNAADVSFIKVDVEGTEHKLCNDILDHFTHSRLCVAIEAKQPYVRKTLEPFEEAGFVVYNLRNNYLWVVDNKIESATYASFADLYGTKYMVDVLLSRKEIPLERLNTQPPGSR
jgi:FkbM family methyltransferase